MSFLRRFAFLALIAVAAPLFAAPNEARPVRIGLLAFLDAEAMSSQWAPLLKHLSSALPDRQLALVQLDHKALREAIANQSVDFVITNPGS